MVSCCIHSARLFMGWWLCLLHLPHLLPKLLHSMKGAMKYLMGFPGPSGFGSNSTGEEVTQELSCSIPSRLTAIITGATSGIGAETAMVLARRGVRLVIAARDLKRGGEVRDRIRRVSPDAEIIVMEMDLSSFASILSFCSQFLSLCLPLNILINNAGKYCHKLELSEDLLEMTFATNYMGHFLLTEILLEKMGETASQTGIEGRIINVSSFIHDWVKQNEFQFQDMIMPKHYNGTRAYAQSKLANVLHVKQIARQLKARKAQVTINAVHPGIVKTGIIKDHRGFITDLIFLITSKLLKSVFQGSSTTCYVALSPKVAGVTGKYFADCNESLCSSLANDENEAQKLWKNTHALLQKRLQ